MSWTSALTLFFQQLYHYCTTVFFFWMNQQYQSLIESFQNCPKLDLVVQLLPIWKHTFLSEWLWVYLLLCMSWKSWRWVSYCEVEIKLNTTVSIFRVWNRAWCPIGFGPYSTTSMTLSIDNFNLTLLLTGVDLTPKGCPQINLKYVFLKQGSKIKISNLIQLRGNFAWACMVTGKLSPNKKLLLRKKALKCVFTSF